jgi:hypothetical protein
MNTKQIIEDAVFQHEIHLREILESFVGSRFVNLKELEKSLKNKTKEPIIIFESETDADFLNDFQLDGEIGNENEFSIFYLKDRKGFLYVTEISF